MKVSDFKLCVVAATLWMNLGAAVPLCLATNPPILLVDDGSIGSPSVIPATPAQKATPVVGQRGVNVDGSLREPGLYGMQPAANPWASDMAATRGGGDVRLDTGSFAPTEVDLALPCAGAPWVIGRSYSGLPSTATSGFQGFNWFQSSQPEVVVSGSRLFIVYGADRYLAFLQIESSGTYRGVNGAAGAVVRQKASDDSKSPYIFRYFDAEGDETDFFADTGDSAAYQIWRVIASDGSVAYVGDPSDAHDASLAYNSLHQITEAHDSAGRTYAYTYSGSGSASRLTSVVATVSWGTIEVGRVEYGYFTSSDTSTIGQAGDLKWARVTTPLSPGQSPLVREQHYRYDSHRVRMVTNPEGGRAAAALSTPINVDTAADSAVQPYASLVLTYDTSGRVATVGRVTSASSPISSNVTYDPASPSAPSAYSASLYKRVIVEDPSVGTPSSVFTTYYFDNAGQALSVLTSDSHPDPSVGTSGRTIRFWATVVERDSSGQVTGVHTPANVDGYTYSSGAFSTRSSAGLALVLDRVTGTTPLTGFLRSVRHKEGSGSGVSAYYDSRVTYLAESSSDGTRTVGTGAGAYVITRPVIDSSRRFPDPVTSTSSGELDTTTDFWFDSTTGLALSKTKAEYPAIAVAHNGENVRYDTGVFYRPDGSVQFTRSRTGRINYYEYDTSTGRLTKFIQDADTSSTADFGSVTVPTDFHTTTGVTPLHRRYEYTYDSQGRRVTASDPANRVRFNFFGLLATGEPFVLQAPDCDLGASPYAIYTGPTTGAILNLDGRTLARFTLGLSTTPTTGSTAMSIYSTTTAPGSWISTSTTSSYFNALWANVTSRLIGDLNTYDYSTNGRELLDRRRYTTNPSGGGGSQHTNYDLTSLTYDAADRLATITSPAGTIDRIDYDLLGRPIYRSRGTDNGSPGNMTTIGQFHWDGGTPTSTADQGNSRLTQYDALPGGGADPRETKFFYDVEGNVLGVLNPVPPYAVFCYNNEHQPLGMAILGGSGFTEPIPNPFDTSLSDRRALYGTLYDEIGQAYQQTAYNVNQSTGAYSTSAGGSVVTNTWYCPEGCVDCQQGTTTVKTEHNRACQCDVIYTATTDPATSGTGYLAMTNVQSTDTVLHEEHRFYNVAGDYLGQATADRTGQDCAAGGGGPLLNSISFNSSGDISVGHSSTPQTWNLEFDSVDPLGRQYWRTDYGNPDYRPSTTIYNSATPLGFGSTAIANAVTSFSRFDPLGRTKDWLHSTADGNPQQTEGQGALYNDGGQQTQRFPEVGGGSDGTTATPCYSKPGGVQTGYGDGHVILEQAIIPGFGDNPGFTSPTRYIYPQVISTPGGIFPGGSPIGLPDVHDNDTILCKIGPTVTDDPNSLTAPHADLTVYAPNNLGEITGMVEPSGFTTVDTLDPLGRPTQRLIYQPSTNPHDFNDDSLRTTFAYDDTGRLNDIKKYATGTSTTPLNEATFGYDGWGMLGGMTQDPGAGFVAGSGQAFPLPINFTNSFFDNHSSGGWSGIRTTDTTFPDGMHIGNTYGACPGGSTGPNIDDLIGRVSSVNLITPGSGGGGDVSTPLVNQWYQGVVKQSLYELPSLGETDPLLRHQFLEPVDTYPLGGGFDPTTAVSDGYGRTQHDTWCAGVNCAPTDPGQYNEDRSYSPSGQIMNSVDNLQSSCSTTYTYPHDCTTIATTTVSMGNGHPAYGTANSGGFSTPPPPQRQEQWQFDAKNNITQYRVDNDPYSASTDFDATDLETDATFDADNHCATLSQYNGGSSSTYTESLAPTYDANGNRTFSAYRAVFYESGETTPVQVFVDGRCYRYDVEGHLTDVWHVADDHHSKGVPWARFTYDGLGHMVSAVYHDHVVSGDTSLTADQIFGAETIEYYVYDQRWRVSQVWRAGPVSGGVRPAAKCYERFVYSSAGLNGRGDAGLLDCPVLSQIDANGDGVFERERKYLQNSRGDVVGVQERDRYNADLTLRYTVYGYPELLLSNDPYNTGDFNGDGDWGTDADVVAFFACVAGTCCPTCASADVNRDGDTATDADISAFFSILAGNAAAALPDTSEIRFGFRGYWWDDHLQLYHVRHRVYDPVGFTWLQPDPAGHVDGLNLYAYCGNDPVNGIDPSGLEPVDIGTIHKGINGGHEDVTIPKSAPHTGWVRRHFYDNDGHYQGYYDFDPNDPVDSLIADTKARDHTALMTITATASTVVVVVETGGEMVGAVISVVVPGPEDVVVGAIMAKYGARAIAQVGKVVYAIAKDGRMVAVEAEEAIALAKTVKKGENEIKTFTTGNFRKNVINFFGKTEAEVVGEEAHHIVAQTDKRAADAREILDKLGINVHDPRNGVMLPGAEHDGIHTTDYYRELTEDLRNAKSKDDALGILDKWRRKLEEAAKNSNAAGGGCPVDP